MTHPSFPCISIPYQSQNDLPSQFASQNPSEIHFYIHFFKKFQIANSPSKTKSLFLYNNSQSQHNSNKTMAESDQSSYSCSRISVIEESQCQIYKKPKKQTIYAKGEHSGKWLQLEKFAYFAFLSFLDDKNHLGRCQKYKQIIGRTPTLFKTMAIFVKSRNLLQCRSYHQKMQKKYGGIKTIIKKGLQKGEKESYMQFYKSKINELQQIYNNYLLGKVKQAGKKKDPSKRKIPAQKTQDTPSSITDSQQTPYHFFSNLPTQPNPIQLFYGLWIVPLNQ